MNQPLLSVIIPAKDQAPFIRDAMTSLTRQFDDPSVMEIIVVDDGSTDGTGELAAAFTGRLPGLQILRNDAALGVASARNRGLDHATGRYITFLDPDDWYAPGHLAKITADIAELGVDFVRVDHIRHTNGHRSRHHAPQARRDVSLDPKAGILPHGEATMVDYCFVWAGIYDRRLKDAGLLYFLDGVSTAEDRPWTWNLHLNASSYAVIDSPGIFYRRGVATSLTQVYDDRQLDFLPCYESIFELVDRHPDAARFWPKAVRQFFAVACHHLVRSSGVKRSQRTSLKSGITSVMSSVPQEVLAAGFAELDRDRTRLLAPMVERSLR
jgi:glycosyltransferase involved in cell wall biosynthesis